MHKIEPQKEKSSLTASAVWLVIAKFVGFVFAFVLPLLIVRVFDQTQVGVYKQVFLFITTWSAILSLNVGLSAFYFLPREPENRGKAVLNILLFNLFVGGLAALTLFLFPGLLGKVFPNSTAEVTKLAPLVGIVILFWITSAFLELVAVANQEAKTATALIIFAQLTKTTLLFLAALVFSTVQSLLIAALLQTIIQTIILLIYLNSRFPRFWTQFDFGFLKRQLLYALPYGFAGLLWTMQLDLHNYFVSYRFTSAEFAVYAYGCFSLPLVGLLNESVAGVLIPRMSELQQDDKRREMINLIVRASQKLALVYFPLYIFLLITAETFVTTLFTKAFIASVVIFQINITLLPFDALAGLDGVARAYEGMSRFLIKVRLILIAGLAIALYFGVWYLNLPSMIAIVVIVSLIERSIMFYKISSILGIKSADVVLLKGIGKIALAAIISGFPLFFVYRYVENLNPFCTFISCDGTLGKFQHLFEGASILAICAIVYGSTYLTAIFLLNALSIDEKKIINTQVVRFQRIIRWKTTSTAL